MGNKSKIIPTSEHVLPTTSLRLTTPIPSLLVNILISEEVLQIQKSATYKKKILKGERKLELFPILFSFCSWCLSGNKMVAYRLDSSKTRNYNILR